MQIRACLVELAAFEERPAIPVQERRAATEDFDLSVEKGGGLRPAPESPQKGGRVLPRHGMQWIVRENVEVVGQRALLLSDSKKFVCQGVLPHVQVVLGCFGGPQHVNRTFDEGKPSHVILATVDRARNQ